MQHLTTHSLFRRLRSHSAGRLLSAVLVAALTFAVTSCRFTQDTTKAPTLPAAPPDTPATVLIPDTLATDTPTAEATTTAPKAETTTTAAQRTAATAKKRTAAQPPAPKAPAPPTAAAPTPASAGVTTPTAAPTAPATTPAATAAAKAAAPPPPPASAGVTTPTAAPAAPSPSTTPPSTTPTTTTPTTTTQPSKTTEMLTITSNILILALLLIILVIVYLLWRRTRRGIEESLHIANEARGKAITALTRCDNLKTPSPAAAVPSAEARLRENPPTTPLSSADATSIDRASQRADRAATTAENAAATANTASETAATAAASAATAVDAANAATAQASNAAAEAAAAHQLATAAQQALSQLSESNAQTRQAVEALSAQLNGILEKINEAAANLAETNLKITKTEERLAEQQTQISQLNSTQKPSRKAASHTYDELDLFAQNAPLSEGLGNSSEIQPVTEASETAPDHAAALGRPAPTFIDLNEAKDKPSRFIERLQETYPAFFEKLATHGPALTKRDIILSILIALETPKEQLLQTFSLTPESFKAARYRIRTKLSLERKENLDDTLHSWI